jgi:putative SOS response-associated peptidase YedK
MPAILRREDEDRWVSSEALSAADLNAILAPYPHGGMEAYPVSPLVNNLNVDDERLIQPLPGL